ncbi:hypothetical protein SAMN04487958_10689 [Vreelandella subterranea]|uniref:Uncharacterized protein n=1 Tax=Vreelandella subterranea TaxID=416874 RepID=A0A1H9U5U7_9GAMM|nr:hypothetical protein SAMN04487958_10689 [Halomonas subterranea]
MERVKQHLHLSTYRKLLMGLANPSSGNKAKPGTSFRMSITNVFWR